MANNRIYYAVQAVKMKPCITTDGGTSYAYGAEKILRGVQSVGITTNFNLEQAYQLGQLELYENIEEVPDIEVTITKALDGTRTAYNIANDGNAASSSDDKSLAELTNRRCDVALGIWDDTKVNTSGSATYYVVCTGMYVSSISYNLVTDGNFTEDITLVGNHKKWGLTSGGGINHFNSGIGHDGVVEGKKMSRRWAFNKDASTLPTGVSGGLPLNNLHINSLTVSTNLGRESINELGKRTPYYRYVSFPVEVTSEIELTASQSDNVDADDFETQTGCTAASASNLTDKTIKLVVCDINSGGDAGNDYTFDLGTKNKLTSVNYTGGDTGGGNATVTYSFQTWNTFKVSSPA
jgi:hypothetical protein